ncbi:hypothetical protein CSOJ01_10180 [Colletotrichum sojae]|uniref:Uncharacterized protein n=1 Tax=Colletotrichum sojae TaxID=2175907 RepID=A0A8H6MQE5_9PEZI|nr:hypothetical protein CSOJ01_10180 [Colletotrichum sojae]
MPEPAPWVRRSSGDPSPGHRPNTSDHRVAKPPRWTGSKGPGGPHPGPLSNRLSRRMSDVSGNRGLVCASLRFTPTASYLQHPTAVRPLSNHPMSSPSLLNPMSDGCKYPTPVPLALDQAIGQGPICHLRRGGPPSPQMRIPAGPRKTHASPSPIEKFSFPPNCHSSHR